MSASTGIRARKRPAQKDLQKQIDELASLCAETSMALGRAMDHTIERVKALEDALKKARGQRSDAGLILPS